MAAIVKMVCFPEFRSFVACNRFLVLFMLVLIHVFVWVVNAAGWQHGTWNVSIGRQASAKKSMGRSQSSGSVCAA
eukprot:4911163-Amphidinium_carterae.1